MRETKFKVFCKKHNREEIYTLGDLVVGNAITQNGEGGIFENWRQYTGLKDKNGVEIYEGDIVRVFILGEYIKGYIKYNEEAGRFDVDWENKIEIYKIGGFVGSCSCMNNYYDKLEVIGNIYNNPDKIIKTRKELYVSIDKLKEIVYPRPDNYIPVEVQCSEMYRKIIKELEGKNEWRR